MSGWIIWMRMVFIICLFPDRKTQKKDITKDVFILRLHKREKAEKTANTNKEGQEEKQENKNDEGIDTEIREAAEDMREEK